MNQSPLTEAEKKQLITKAEAAWKNAYAPYSKFQVGAALLTDQGKIFTGCNVENASYGLSMCAERNVIANAIAKLGAKNLKIRAIAIANNRKVPCSPCGACRQVISEFGTNINIIFVSPQGYQHLTIAELLPQEFSALDIF
ncbi:MAG: cytidine deaminase [Xenococcaceae cyanobacterium MO_167.B52]|nr:cytidine deaminase [Xenococcaceae cyanobacterium MO_167.B52]